MRTLKQEKEIVATHFIHNGSVIGTKFALSQVDLGSVIASTAALRRSNLKFGNSIPKRMIEIDPGLSRLEKDVALMRSFHDNDWWFVQKAVYEIKFDAAIVTEVLFYHN